MTVTPGEMDALELEAQVCFALSVASRGVVATYRPLLEPLGLTHPQYLVMVCLWQHGPQSVKQLGTRLALDSGTLSPLIKRLEAMELVERARGPIDERQVTVSLTAASEGLRSKAGEVHSRVVRRLSLKPAEIEELRRMLARVIESSGPPYLS